MFLHISAKGSQSIQNLFCFSLNVGFLRIWQTIYNTFLRVFTFLGYHKSKKSTNFFRKHGTWDAAHSVVQLECQSPGPINTMANPKRDYEFYKIIII